MPYYAHIRQDENGETIYQTVAEHLTGTAALCREFAADFGAEADGDLMGLAHDLGKCTDAFQKRLLEGGPVVDHTTAGMLTCIRMKRPSAAACVAGHHGGLLDVGNLRTDRAGEATLSGRFKKGVEGHYLERCGESGVTLPTLPPETPERDPLKASFRTRMLYSCLVDADFLDTEREVNVLRCDKKRVQKLSHRSPSIAPRRYAETDLLLISFGRHNPFSEQALQPFVGFTFGVLPRA